MFTIGTYAPVHARTKEGEKRKESWKEMKDLTVGRKNMKKEVSKHVRQGKRDMEFDTYRIKQMLSRDISDHSLYLILNDFKTSPMVARRKWLMSEAIVPLLVQKVKTTPNKYIKYYLKNIMRESLTTQELYSFIEAFDFNAWSIDDFTLIQRTNCKTGP
jgi:hypothetical protein